MPAVTRCLVFIQNRLPQTTRHVLFVRNPLKVIRVDATSSPAKVVWLKPFGQCSAFAKPHHTMRQWKGRPPSVFRPSAARHAAVAFRVKRAGPKPASRIRINRDELGYPFDERRFLAAHLFPGARRSASRTRRVRWKLGHRPRLQFVPPGASGVRSAVIGLGGKAVRVLPGADDRLQIIQSGLGFGHGAPPAPESPKWRRPSRRLFHGGLVRARG
jgi:hypothetical protein